MSAALVTPLDVMHSIVATAWAPGDGPSTTIKGWLNFIAGKYPETAKYCNSAAQLNYFEWCGLTVGYCMAKVGVEPVFGDGDLKRFLWADAWLGEGDTIATPQPGDVVVFHWPHGGAHVTLFSADAGDEYWTCLGGNQSHEVKYSNFPRSAVAGVRRPGAAAAPIASAAALPVAHAASADDRSVRNAYPELDVIAYARTTMTPAEIAALLAALDFDINVKRSAFALICNESANGGAGIINNYGGLQADVGRWAHRYDPLISATCVKTDNSGAKRRFVCFADAQNCMKMIADIVKSRGIYIGGATSFITHIQVQSPGDWALAYYREWVTGDANAALSPPARNNLLSLYQSAIAALPDPAVA
jgi:hypothetical protein